MHALVLVLALLAPDDAAARRWFERGNAASADGRYQDALASYREALRIAPRPSILYNIARCEELLGQDEAAWLDYSRFLELAGDHPQAAEAREKLARLAERVRVKVQVESDPPGAEVRVDGGPPAGLTPTTVEVAAGRHRVSLSAAHAVPQDLEFVARIGSPAQVRAHLVRHAHIEISVEPVDATIEGAGATAAGHLATDVEPGRLRFTLRRGAAERVLELEAAAGETVREHVTLATPPGLLQVEAVAGATVFVDALPVGQTPLRTEVAAGQHWLSVEAPGWRPLRTRIQVAAGQPTAIVVHLAPERSRAARIGTWTLGGLGAASALAGGVVALLAADNHADFAEMPTRDAADRGRTYNLAADVLLGTGAAALAAWGVIRAWPVEESRVEAIR